MIILDSTISQVSRNRDFGRIEARVTFLAKTRAGQPPHPLSVMTNVAVRGAAPLRERLTADAALLATSLVGQTRQRDVIAA